MTTQQRLAALLLRLAAQAASGEDAERLHACSWPLRDAGFDADALAERAHAWAVEAVEFIQKARTE